MKEWIEKSMNTIENKQDRTREKIIQMAAFYEKCIDSDPDNRIWNLEKRKKIKNQKI